MGLLQVYKSRPKEVRINKERVFMGNKKNLRESIKDFYTIFSGIKLKVNQLIMQEKDTDYTVDPSVDIAVIAKKTGITGIEFVQPSVVQNNHSILNENRIFINYADNQEEQRFSIAHELSHFISNKGNITHLRKKNKKVFMNSEEAINKEIADYFAANLLVPTERFILWEDKSDSKIAKAFKVSKACIKKRREEIEHELEFLTPKDLSSNVNLDEQVPLSLKELDQILRKLNIS